MQKAGIGVMAFMFLAAGAWAQQNSRLDGCLALQDSHYVLLQGQNTTYRLQGQPKQLKQHLGELVRIEGRVGPGSAITIANVDKLAPDCSAVMPPGSATDAIVGKVGGTQVQVPVTTTGTAGETTPPYQTPAGRAQQPGQNTLPTTVLPPTNKNQPGAPPDWEQAGQTPEQANTIAEGAQRTAIQPGAPLGTNPAAPESSGEKLPQKVPRTAAGSLQDRIVKINDQGCLPMKLTIRPGEVVQWVNTTRSAVRVKSTTSTPLGQNGTGVFGSGKIGAGQIFRQVFDKPGTYRYACTVGNQQKGTGEVDVREQ